MPAGAKNRATVPVPSIVAGVAPLNPANVDTVQPPASPGVAVVEGVPVGVREDETVGDGVGVPLEPGDGDADGANAPEQVSCRMTLFPV